MGLKEYQAKRNFKKSPEPNSQTKKKAGIKLRFCVQKHAARRLHFDFRLEHRGVLLSWAVPKGPSLNPQEKRLAVKVEDHPLEYQYFEGIIPEGNYGAGKVEIWDSGIYEYTHSEDTNESDKKIEKGLHDGHLAITLFGDKLKGDFILQKLKKDDPDDHQWLLIKKDDTFAYNEENQIEERKKKF
jgi:bifunctional non-homologous end joining protein LigD